MAAKMMGETHTYIGTAAEMATLGVTGIPIGSRYFQTDTGFWYVNGGAAWIKELIPAS